MTTNLFVMANVKQLRTGGSFRILLLKLLTVSPEGEMPLRRYKYRHRASEYSTGLVYIIEAAVAYPGILFGRWAQQIQLRTERMGIWGR